MDRPRTGSGTMSTIDRAASLERVRATRFPALVSARRVGRQTLRGAVIWGVVFGLFWWLLVNDFTTNYPTLADRQRLVAETGANIGMQAMFGPIHHIDTVAGYAAWHGVGFLAIIGAIWGLLTGSRLLRGEEESGRWEWLVAGQTTRGGGTAAALGGLGSGLLVLWTINTVAAFGFGRSADPPWTLAGSAFLAMAVVAPAAVFLGVGALCSQLAGSRRQAAWLAAAVFGVAYLIRLIAYTDTSVLWLRWASPLAWVDELHPLTDTRPWPLALILALIVALTLATVALAGRRDLGAATLPSRDTAVAHTGLLGRPLGLSARLARAGAFGWIVSLAVAGLVFGSLAKTSAEVFASASGGALEELAGVNGGKVYLGITFLVVAVVITLAACGQVTATRDEEIEGRLDNLLVRPVARIPWLAGRVAVSAVVLVAAGIVAGVAAWLGAVLGGADIGFTALLAAGLNVVPAGLFVLGIGTLAHGLAPRLAGGVVYGLVVWSFTAELVGAGLPASQWLRELSVLHHITRAPAQDPRWGMSAVLVLIGLAAALIGTIAFARRDLEGN